MSSTTTEDVSVIRTSSERSPCAGDVVVVGRSVRQDSTYGPVSATGTLMSESLEGSFGEESSICGSE